MATERPVWERLGDAEDYFRKLADRMAAMSRDARDAIRGADQAVQNAQHEQLSAELARDAARGELEALEDGIEDLRLGLLTREELIERCTGRPA